MTYQRQLFYSEVSKAAPNPFTIRIYLSTVDTRLKVDSLSVNVNSYCTDLQTKLSHG